MHVAYISNENITIDEALSRFKDYCDTPNELHFLTSLWKAKDFLTHEVIEFQKHIDLISILVKLPQPCVKQMKFDPIIVKPHKLPLTLLEILRNNQRMSNLDVIYRMLTTNQQY